MSTFAEAIRDALIFAAFVVGVFGVPAVVVDWIIWRKR